MKSALSVLAIALSFNSYALTTCHSTKAFQVGSAMQSDVELNFDLTKAGNESEIKNIVGHVFVKSPYEANAATYSTEDSYMGFFKIDSIKANNKYRPNKYKGYAQFQKFNAIHTTGLEDGMWGDLVLDVSSTEATFNGAYVFQAGDHMGGTILLSCETR